MAGCVNININITRPCAGKGRDQAPPTMHDTNQWREENRENPWPVTFPSLQFRHSRTVSYDSRVPLSPHLLHWSLKACLGLVLVKGFAVCNHQWCCKVVNQNGS